MERKHKFFLILGLTVGWAFSATADQWQFSTQASQSLVFDSNIRLSTTDQQAVVGSITTLGASVGLVGPRADARINGNFSILRYSGNTDLNSESFGLGFQSAYRTPRSVYGLGANVSRSSSLVTELNNTGNFSRIANVLSLSVAPSWSHQLSSLESVGVSGAFRYSTSDSADFASQSSYSLGGTWSRQLTSVDSISFGPQVSVIRSDGTGLRTTTQSIAASFGWSRTIGERLVFNASAGPRISFTQRRSSLFSDDEVAFGADVNLILSYRISERTTLSVSGSQGLEPASDGTIQERQRVAVTLGHTLSEKARIAFNGSIQRNSNGASGNSPSSLGSSSLGQTDGTQRLYFASGANASYQISPVLSAAADYSFRAQELGGARSFAFSHAFAIVLTYSPRQWMFRD